MVAVETSMYISFSPHLSRLVFQSVVNLGTRVTPCSLSISLSLTHTHTVDREDGGPAGGDQAYFGPRRHHELPPGPHPAEMEAQPQSRGPYRRQVRLAKLAKLGADVCDLLVGF